ncbi:MAG: ThuA domain-containing protein [Clostridia bacterium]|nr:ThuA domain-containing protein [Clostridia bacterium]
MIRVTIYNEFVHEKTDEAVRSIYPEGIHMALKQHLEDEEIHIKTVTLDDLPEGLSDEVLEDTDVLIWWGHIAHHKVPDEVAVRVQQAVLRGMGMIVLHSGHHSKPFKLLMGTSCNLTWREDGDYELVWVCNPAHPITQGVGRFIKLEEEETYGEPFGIPEPDELVFIGGYEGGEVFRSGCCYRKENGRVFYFQPGHETVPTYHHPEILKVIKNAIRWANPIYRVKQLDCPHVTKPLGE